ncbi:MAG: TolC family protein, partial [Smithellaceae bacterium]|nr:TolC family protein [Smithellaceae bacterium]
MNRYRVYFVAAAIFLSLVLSPVRGQTAEYTLPELCRLSLEHSEIIKAARENVNLAKVNRRKALSLLIPRATAFGSYTRFTKDKYADTGFSQTLIQPDAASSWGVRLDQTFSLSGRELTALDIAGEDILRSNLDFDTVREDFLLAVANGYYGVLKARKAIDIATANVERLTKYRSAAEKRLKIGEVTKTVLLRAESELSGAQSDLIQARNALEIAKAQLSRLTGIGDADVLKEEQLSDKSIPELSSFQQIAYARREDLRSLEHQKLMAEKQVSFTKGSFWPYLSLSAVYTGSDQTPPSLTLNRESTYAGAALNFPFFEGGLRKAEVEESRARQRQAESAYQDQKKVVEVDVRSAYLDMETQRGIMKFLDDQLVFARDNFGAVSRQFEFGLSSSLDVMDANTL